MSTIITIGVTCTTPKYLKSILNQSLSNAV